MSWGTNLKQKFIACKKNIRFQGQELKIQKSLFFNQKMKCSKKCLWNLKKYKKYMKIWFKKGDF